MGRRGRALGILTLGLGLLALPSTASASAYSTGLHREPLPTMTVVDEPRRVRLLDVRGPVQFGGGWSSLYRAPVYAMSFEAQISFVELTDTTWLHLVFGESGMVSAVQPDGDDPHPGFFGADLGLGLSRYASRGPAFLISGTAGPRWGIEGPERLRPHGWGVQGKAEVFPFYATVPELVDDERGWFRRYVLSGVNLWASARYDQILGRRGNTWAGGIGLDLGRSVILPVVQAVGRR